MPQKKKQVAPPPKANQKKRKAIDDEWPEGMEEAIGIDSDDDEKLSSEDSEDGEVLLSEDELLDADSGDENDELTKMEDVFLEQRQKEDEDEEEENKEHDEENEGVENTKSIVEQLDELGNIDALAFLKTTPEEDPDLFYDSEDSENERTLNTIGDVPLRWYEDMDHIGYDLLGEPIRKPEQEDVIDEFIQMNETPQGWRTVRDEKTGQKIVISDRDLEYIRRLQKGELPEKYSSENWFIPIEGRVSSIMPTLATPEPKRRFVPSLWEAKRIRRLAYAIKKGWIKLDKAEVKKEPEFFLIWDEGEQEKKGGYQPERLPAPKPRLPGHAESYNPPEEYLLTEEEFNQWKEKEPWERPNYVPRKYNSLREVPGWLGFHRERFERCLDLYLVARARKKKPKYTMDQLVPQLPKPAELRPFPSHESLLFLGHEGRVRCISVDPLGQWLVSGSEDNTIRVWEIKTARCMKVWKVPGTVVAIDWNPFADISVIAAALEDRLLFYTPPTATAAQSSKTNALFELPKGRLDMLKGAIEWKRPTTEEWDDGLRLTILYKNRTSSIRFLTWHRKGDYIATVSPDAPHSAVVVHQISKRQSQSPFRKNKNKIQCVRFHPSKPFFFVASQRSVKIYNLLKQELVKKLNPGAKWISSMDIHPGGDNVIVGTYDKKVCWFDLDLSVKPYKTMRYHEYCIRSVRFHKRYPLFASCSDDGTVQVFHATVYDDLLKSPLIVPLKILRGHKVVDDLGVLDIMFHPTQPWIFSAGADETIRLYT